MSSKNLKRYIVIVLAACSVFLLLYEIFFDNMFSTVVEGRIYRSAQLSEDDLKKYIQEKDIKTILNLRGRGEGRDWYEREDEIAKKYHVKLRNVGISSNELPRIDKMIPLLDALFHAERPILIHCKRGVDRTGFVSALALAIEKDPPLNVIKKQFSVRYGVFPFYRSVGPYFFSQYERWLGETGETHSKDVLLYWIANDYIDDKGNLMFWLDSVNNEIFNDTKIHIENAPEELTIKGWAFDFKTKTPPDGIVYIRPDNEISSRAIFKYNRPDVARYFNLGRKYYETFVVGWEAVFKKKDFSQGCHNIYIKYTNHESIQWDFETEFQLCLN